MLGFFGYPAETMTNRCSRTNLPAPTTGMPTTHADTVDADLPAFIRS